MELGKEAVGLLTVEQTEDRTMESAPSNPGSSSIPFADFLP